MEALQHQRRPERAELSDFLEGMEREYSQFTERVLSENARLSGLVREYAESRRDAAEQVQRIFAQLRDAKPAEGEAPAPQPSDEAREMLARIVWTIQTDAAERHRTDMEEVEQLQNQVKAKEAELARLSAAVSQTESAGHAAVSELRGALEGLKEENRRIAAQLAATTQQHAEARATYEAERRVLEEMLENAARERTAQQEAARLDSTRLVHELQVARAQSAVAAQRTAVLSQQLNGLRAACVEREQAAEGRIAEVQRVYDGVVAENKELRNALRLSNSRLRTVIEHGLATGPVPPPPPASPPTAAAPLSAPMPAAVAAVSAPQSPSLPLSGAARPVPLPEAAGTSPGPVPGPTPGLPNAAAPALTAVAPAAAPLTGYAYSPSRLVTPAQAQTAPSYSAFVAQYHQLAALSVASPTNGGVAPAMHPAGAPPASDNMEGALRLLTEDQAALSARLRQLQGEVALSAATLSALSAQPPTATGVTAPSSGTAGPSASPQRPASRQRA